MALYTVPTGLPQAGFSVFDNKGGGITIEQDNNLHFDGSRIVLTLEEARALIEILPKVVKDAEAEWQAEE